MIAHDVIDIIKSIIRMILVKRLASIISLITESSTEESNV